MAKPPVRSRTQSTSRPIANPFSSVCVSPAPKMLEPERSSPASTLLATSATPSSSRPIHIQKSSPRRHIIDYSGFDEELYGFTTNTGKDTRHLLPDLSFEIEVDLEGLAKWDLVRTRLVNRLADVESLLADGYC